MAKLNKATFLAFFFCFLIIASFEMQMGEAKPCSKLSKGWRGSCANHKCSHYCQQHEGAYNGLLFLLSSSASSLLHPSRCKWGRQNLAPNSAKGGVGRVLMINAAFTVSNMRELTRVLVENITLVSIIFATATTIIANQ
ncbi:unnamed protein product [Fraxinus pennsylvanica]|uniref:Uncharacterized protein n=1 Tax=Fraxinus pennsylvanica TaxID=56036 RepID=A0AAD2E9U0_9LAMI|nr:unnamed protein product [Fraxinus pennsylvanica]